MAANDIVRVGTDPSGRPVYMTRRMRRWWGRLCRRLGFKPTIVQGAWMVKAGGGAQASAGYHDGGGCLDVRVWDLDATQQERFIREGRKMGAAVWRRDREHGGMDPHFHLVLGCDFGLAAGAQLQWVDYIAGRDGLDSKGNDYHWRPDPLVLRIPPSTRKLRDLLGDAKDEAKRLGFPVADRIRNIRDRIPK